MSRILDAYKEAYGAQEGVFDTSQRPDAAAKQFYDSVESNWKKRGSISRIQADVASDSPRSVVVTVGSQNRPDLVPVAELAGKAATMARAHGCHLAINYGDEVQFVFSEDPVPT